MDQRSEPGRSRWGQKLRGASPVAGRDELVTGAVPAAQAGDSAGLPAGSAMAEHAMARHPEAGIGSVTHHLAMEPIRIYAGLKSAGGLQAQASLAVRDLQRAGGFSRKNLLVVTTTGSGWVVPALADSFEYLSDGDSATVAIQYSYLPSWISYLTHLVVAVLRAGLQRTRDQSCEHFSFQNGP